MVVFCLVLGNASGFDKLFGGDYDLLSAVGVYLVAVDVFENLAVVVVVHALPIVLHHVPACVRLEVAP